MSLAYTWTNATENRIFSDNFAQNYPTLEDYGTNDAVGIAEHRVVITGTYDLPWGLLFAARFSADPGENLQFDTFPGNLADGPNPDFGEHQDSVSDTRTAKLTFGFDW